MGRVSGGILFITMGAILAFGFDIDLGPIRLDVIGWILMASGLAYVVVGYTAQVRVDREVGERRENLSRAEQEVHRDTHGTL